MFAGQLNGHRFDSALKVTSGTLLSVIVPLASWKITLMLLDYGDHRASMETQEHQNDPITLRT